MSPSMYTIASLYHFTRFDDPIALKPPLLALCQQHDVKGTLLLAQEGVNGTIAGTHVLLRAVRGADKNAITDGRIFDVFTGGNLPEGMKSLALEVTLQPQEKSFQDADLKAISDKVVAAAAKLGAELRG